MNYINKSINNLFIVALYIIGIIFGIILSKNYSFNIPDQTFSLKHLITIFSCSFFMFYIIYISRKSHIILLFLPIITFFRGFSLGVLINALLFNNFILCLVITIIEFVLSMFLLCFIINNKTNENKLLIIITTCVLLYSVLLEIVGDKIG